MAVVILTTPSDSHSSDSHYSRPVAVVRIVILTTVILTTAARCALRARAAPGSVRVSESVLTPRGTDIPRRHPPQWDVCLDAVKTDTDGLHRARDVCLAVDGARAGGGGGGPGRKSECECGVWAVSAARVSYCACSAGGEGCFAVTGIRGSSVVLTCSR